jgi:hypothetical protein
MAWRDEEDEFEWKDEDEEEVPPGAGTSLSRINRVATVVFLALLGLGAVLVVIRLVKALGTL